MFFPHINHPPVRYFFGRVISMFGFPDFLPTHFRKETRNGKKKDIPKKMEEKRIRRGEQKIGIGQRSQARYCRQFRTKSVDERDRALFQARSTPIRGECGWSRRPARGQHPTKSQANKWPSNSNPSSTLAYPAAVTADFHRSQPFSPPRVDRISQQNVFFSLINI